MNPLLGRWVSADPLAVHAPGEADLNLYAYVHGTVLKSVDPLGLYDTTPMRAPVDSEPRSVVLLVDSESAGGSGHMGVLIEDEAGVVNYLSTSTPDMNPEEDAVPQSVGAGDTTNAVVLMPLYTSDDVAQMSRPMTVDEAREFALEENLEGYAYTTQVVVSATGEDTEQMMTNAKGLEEASEAGDVGYNAFYNNCADAVSDVVEEGTSVDLPFGLDPRPNSFIEEVVEAQPSEESMSTPIETPNQSTVSE